MRAAAPAGRHWTWIAVGAIAAGLVLRLVWVLVLHPPFEHVYSDMAGYVDRATKLVETRLSDPERIRFFVGQLNKRAEERAYAITQLRASGPP